jgi:hypothetical protein
MASPNAMRVIDIDVSHFFFIIVTHLPKKARVLYRAKYFFACPIAIKAMESDVNNFIFKIDT